MGWPCCGYLDVWISEQWPQPCLNSTKTGLIPHQVIPPVGPWRALPAVKEANQEERLWRNGNDPREHDCRGLCLSPILLHVSFLPPQPRKEISLHCLGLFFPKGFPCIVPRREESNLFWNKGEKAGGEMQRELWEFPTENIINKRTVCSLHTLLFGCVRQTAVIIKNQ